ncbi:MAG: alpha-galactosidase, partial [Candidatus Hydrogenedentes bacterium]|nr:alpha-galactosidase [Candidatus Hydrogenedentota bacterium]
MNTKLFLIVLCVSGFSWADSYEKLPLLPDDEAVSGQDWLVHAVEKKATVYGMPDGKSIALSNGLLRRIFRITPNAATVSLDNLPSDEALLRGVKPEAVLVIDGKRI